MSTITALIKTLTAPASRFFMPMDEFISELASYAPWFLNKQTPVGEAYIRKAQKQLEEMQAIPGANLTGRYNDPDIPEQSIAYYLVKGTIVSDSNWHLSTRQLLNDIARAETNDKISAHFFHISSGGGEAYLLDQLADVIHTLKKPAHAFIERVAGSAAYYIASQTNFISAATPFDTVGSIGTMVSFMDLRPMLEKWGINFIEEYASQSDLKNRKYKDLIAGKPDQFITEELDPLAEKFIADVKRARPQLANLDAAHPAMRGETFYASQAMQIGLIDQVESINAAVARLADKINAPSSKKSRKQAIHILNQ